MKGVIALEIWPKSVIFLISIYKYWKQEQNLKTYRLRRVLHTDQVKRLVNILESIEKGLFYGRSNLSDNLITEHCLHGLL